MTNVLLYQAFCLRNIQLLDSSEHIKKISQCISSSVRTYSNTEMLVMQDTSMLYVVTEELSFNLLKSLKHLFPAVSEIRFIHQVDTQQVRVSSLHQTETFNIECPNLDLEDPYLRAQLFSDYVPYAVDLETFSETALYTQIPDPFVVSQLRGRYGILAPYHYHTFNQQLR